MRFKYSVSTRKEGDNETKTWFAILPVWIDNEIRWLEKVTVLGYWSEGMLAWNWRKLKFIDNQ